MFNFLALAYTGNMKLSEMNNLNTSRANDSSAKMQAKKSIQDAYEELKGYSSEDLMTRLAREIQQQKASGSFDYDGLKNTIDAMKIYLPDQVYQN